MANLFQLTIRDDSLRGLRKRLLTPESPLPTTPGALESATCQTWQEAFRVLTEGLQHNGLGLARLTRPLAVDDFIALGQALGVPLEETDPAVAPFISSSIVLSIHDQVHSDDDRLAPFTSQELLLHTEGSRRPAGQQPRYIVLMCQDPGTAGDRAQTVLASVPAILAQLTATDLDVLSRTRETNTPGTGSLILREEESVRLSFRDLGEGPYELESPYSGSEVSAALLNLLHACYSVRPAYGVTWRRGDLVAIDNRFWMHGRTRSRPADGPARHLQRLRILSS